MTEQQLQGEEEPFVKNSLNLITKSRTAYKKMLVSSDKKQKQKDETISSNKEPNQGFSFRKTQISGIRSTAFNL